MNGRYCCGGRGRLELLVTVVLMVLVQTQGRPVDEADREKEEQALTDLHRVPKVQVQPGMPSSLLKGQTLTSQLAGLKQPMHLGPPQEKEEAVDIPSETNPETANQEEVGDTNHAVHYDGEAVDDKDMAWEGMGYSEDALRAIGSVVRDIERSLLQGRLAAAEGRLRGAGPDQGTGRGEVKPQLKPQLKPEASLVNRNTGASPRRRRRRALVHGSSGL